MKRGKCIMNIEIVKVATEEREILARLIELYEYDFSEYENRDVNFLGLYGYTYLDYYWTEERRFPYFIKVNNKLAGFAMVCDYCYISKDKDTLFMSEFFVMKKYRRSGIGKYAAKKVFDMHPGKWELTVHPNNPISHIFWESVIKEIVGNDFQKHFDAKDVYYDEIGIAYTFRNDL